MLACSIALGGWCAGLSWFHHQEDVKRRQLVEGVDQDEKGEEGESVGPKHV